MSVFREELRNIAPLPPLPVPTGYEGGTGAFTSMRIVAGRIPLLRHHRDRLLAAAELFRAERAVHSGIDGQDPILAAASGAVEALQGRPGRLRMSLVLPPGGSPLPPILDAVRGELTLEALDAERRRGWCLLAGVPPVTARARELARFKWLPYDRERTVLAMARAAGCDDGVLTNERGELMETTRGNIFAVDDDGRLWTPSLDSGCVAGIVRGCILELAEDWGMPVSQEPRPEHWLREASHVFVTNAVLGAMPVRRIGDIELPACEPWWRDWLNLPLGPVR